MPIGMPGWPESAFCTASMASARMALAISAWLASAVICSCIGTFGAAVGTGAPCLLATYGFHQHETGRSSIGAGGHGGLDGVVAHKKLAQGQRVALSRPVGDVDLADLVAQMPGFRDQVP